VLLTGGTGYIGAHVLDVLKNRGSDVVVVDDVATGKLSRIGDVPLVRTDLSDPAAEALIVGALRDHRVQAVVHLAARKQVAESVSRPGWYYRQNLGGLNTVLSAMKTVGVRDLVYSSSAAVYGQVASESVGEDDPVAPINPYGETKLIGEWFIRNAASEGWINPIALRYFNVAGAARAELADTAVLNLIPMVFDRIDHDEAPEIFGDRYSTPDGTCVRDFVHVSDLADAHAVALDALVAESAPSLAYNVGTGRGYSVREVIDEIARVAERELTAIVRSARPGDPPRVVANVSRIEKDLGWVSSLSLHDMVSSAWQAHSSPRDDQILAE